jgi:hypothetical protein
MRKSILKSITVYFNEAEHQQIVSEAEDHGVTVSAYVRARLGLAVTQRGAPIGNSNRQGAERPKKKKGHARR